jgi:hypothetical protein
VEAARTPEFQKTSRALDLAKKSDAVASSAVVSADKRVTSATKAVTAAGGDLVKKNAAMSELASAKTDKTLADRGQRTTGAAVARAEEKHAPH